MINRVVKIAVLAFLPVCTGNSLSLAFLLLELGEDTDGIAENNWPKDIPDYVGLWLVQ